MTSEASSEPSSTEKVSPLGSKEPTSTPRFQWQQHDPSSKKNYIHPSWGEPAANQASPEEQRQFAKDFGSVLVITPMPLKRQKGSLKK